MLVDMRVTRSMWQLRACACYYRRGARCVDVSLDGERLRYMKRKRRNKHELIESRTARQRV